jgi:hypothetical protein
MRRGSWESLLVVSAVVGLDSTSQVKKRVRSDGRGEPSAWVT